MQKKTKKLAMERVVPQPFLIIAIFLIAFLTTSSTTEGGRDFPSDKEVSDPQSFSGPLPTFGPSSFPQYPWLGDFNGQPSSRDKHGNPRGSRGGDWSPFRRHWGFPWCPWFWGVHGSKETGMGKNQGFYDAQLPVLHHWSFPQVGGINAGATMNKVAGSGNQPKADGNKVAGETP